MRPARSVRDALAQARAHTPDQVHECISPATVDTVAADYAARFGGIPATSRSCDEDIAIYSTVDGSVLPVLLGMYGAPARVRGWLPGLPRRTSPETARRVLEARRPPRLVADPPCARVDATPAGLGALPVLRATPRDAGPFLTMGLLCAHSPSPARPREVAMSVHRMLVLDDRRLTLWTVPGRQLRAAYEAAVSRGERLPVTINIGAPPAAMIASALGSRFLPPGLAKIDVAGALAGEPLALAPAASQPAWVLAETEIAVEGYLDATTADECRTDPPGVSGGMSLPEFLGYDGAARPALPVVTVTKITTRESALYQAVIGPGREQSVILGLAGALSVALSELSGLPEPSRDLIHDLHFSPAGGGMLLLTVSVRKHSPDCDARLGPLARRIFTAHPFVKLIIFTDQDVDITATEDVLWAVTTRANLGTDASTVSGFTPLGMDPSQGAAWAAERGPGGTGRTWIDATVPFRLRHGTARSFPALVGGDR